MLYDSLGAVCAIDEFLRHTEVTPSRISQSCRRAVFFTSMAAVLWGSWPAFAAVATPAPPFFILTIAALAGYMFSLTTSAVHGAPFMIFQVPLRTQAVVATGLLGTNSFFLFAMPRIGAAEASILSFLWPILLIFIMSWRGNRRLTKVQYAGVAIGFLGAVFAIGPTFNKGFDPLGVLLALLGALSFAVYSAIRAHGTEPYDVVGPSLGFIAIAACGLHLLTETRPALELQQWLAMACIGVLSLNLANRSWDKATRTGQIEIITSIAYLTPLVTLSALAALGIQEVTPFAIFGGVLVIFAAFVVSSR